MKMTSTVDLTVSNESIDPETRMCANLLSAVIVQAIRDASRPLDSHEKKAERSSDMHANSALDFLFDGGDSSGWCQSLCELIGIDCDAMRQGLMAKRYAPDRVDEPYKSTSRRALHVRVNLRRRRGWNPRGLPQ